MPLSATEIKDLLQGSKTVAVVGISNKPDRASYGVAKYLQEHSHFELYFVNPLLDEVLGQQVYKSLIDSCIGSNANITWNTCQGPINI